MQQVVSGEVSGLCPDTLQMFTGGGVMREWGRGCSYCAIVRSDHLGGVGSRARSNIGWEEKKLSTVQ